MIKNENPVNQDNSKTLILRAASLEFCAAGFAGARMASIADRAGVNKALLHYYFKNKQNLYLEVLNFSMDLFWGRIMGEVGELSPSRDLVDVFQTLVQEAMSMLNEEEVLRQIIFRELGDGGCHIMDIQDCGGCQGPVDLLLESLAHSPEFQGKSEHAPLHFFINLMGMMMNTWHSLPFYADRVDLQSGSLSQEFINERIQEINKTIQRYFQR